MPAAGRAAASCAGVLVLARPPRPNDARRDGLCASVRPLVGDQGGGIIQRCASLGRLLPALPDQLGDLGAQLARDVALAAVGAVVGVAAAAHGASPEESGAAAWAAGRSTAGTAAPEADA